MSMVIINKWSNLIHECLDWTGSLEPGDAHRQTERQKQRQAEPVEGVTQVDRGMWTQVYTGTS